MRSVRSVALLMLLAFVLGSPLAGQSATRTSFPQEYLPMRDPIVSRTTGCTAATLNAAIAAAGATPQLLWLSPVDGTTTTCTWTLAENVLIPSTLGLYWPQGTQVCPASGKTLTINGPLLGNPMHQLKAAGCAGKIVFGTNTPAVHASWWGGATDSTLAAAVADIDTASKTLVIDGPTTWALAASVTIPTNIPVHIPSGARVTIANNQTLTLAACPTIEAAGWLQPGTTGRVRITAAGCPIVPHKFATGGNGMQTSPWTGWDTALVWESGSTSRSQDFHAGTHYAFACGNYTQVAKVILPNSFSYVLGDATGGPGCVHIDFAPTGAADGDGYYTAWEFGTVDADGGTFWGRFENIQLFGHDLTKKKRGIHILDMRHFTIRNVTITGYDPLCTTPGAIIDGLGFCDTATLASVGVHVEGREFIHIEDSWIVANRPLILDGTPPGKGLPENIDYNLDVTSFHNISFWQFPDINPSISHSAPIYFAPLVFVSNFDISGTCSLIGGEHGIYFDQSAVNTNRQPSSNNMTIANCRSEGFQGTSYRYWFVGQGLSSAGPETLTHNLKFTNIKWAGGGVSKGFWIEKIGYVLFDSSNLKNANYGFHMDNMPNIAVHLGVNTYPVTFLNSWLVDSSFVELTGNQCIYFNSGSNGRYGPFRGAPLVVVDLNDSEVGCTQLPFTPTIPAFPGVPDYATSPPMNAGQPFVPMLRGDTGPGSDDNVYAERYGYWARSGKLVMVFARIVLTTKGSWAGSVSLNFANESVATGNKPPPPPSALQENNQGLTVRYGNITLPFGITCTSGTANSCTSSAIVITCMEGTPNTCTAPTPTITCTAGSAPTCTADANNITQLHAILAPHYNEPPGTEPANNPSVSGNVVFLAMGNGIANNNFLTWAALTNTTTIEVSGTYMTEN